MTETKFVRDIGCYVRQRNYPAETGQLPTVTQIRSIIVALGLSKRAVYAVVDGFFHAAAGVLRPTTPAAQPLYYFITHTTRERKVDGVFEIDGERFELGGVGSSAPEGFRKATYCEMRWFDIRTRATHVYLFDTTSVYDTIVQWTGRLLKAADTPSYKLPEFDEAYKGWLRGQEKAPLWAAYGVTTHKLTEAPGRLLLRPADTPHYMPTAFKKDYKGWLRGRKKVPLWFAYSPPEANLRLPTVQELESDPLSSRGRFIVQDEKGVPKLYDVTTQKSWRANMSLDTKVWLVFVPV